MTSVTKGRPTTKEGREQWQAEKNAWRNCVQCGKGFHGQTRVTKYCSNNCRSYASVLKRRAEGRMPYVSVARCCKRDQKWKFCPICGKKFDDAE